MTKLHNATHTMKFAFNRGNSRVWLEGSKLLAAGILPGMEYVKSFNIGLNLLTLDFAPMGGAKTNRVAGTADRPILDICSKAVSQFANGAKTYNATIERDLNAPMIYISAIHNLDTLNRG